MSSGIPFHVLWRDAVLKSDLSAAAKVVAFGIGQFANADGSNVWPSAQAVADRFGWSVRNVERHRPAIVKAGLLTQVATAVRGVRGTEFRLAVPTAKTDRTGGPPDDPRTARLGAKTDSSGSRRPTGMADNQFSTSTGNQTSTDSAGEVVVAGIRFVDLPEPDTFAAAAGGIDTPPLPVAPVGAPSLADDEPGPPLPDRSAVTWTQVPINKPVYENPYAVERSQKGYKRTMQNEFEILRDDPRFQHYVEMVESGEIRDWQDVPPLLQQWAARRLQSR